MENKKQIKDIIALADELRWQVGRDFHDKLTEGIYAHASEISKGVVIRDSKREHNDIDSKIDQIVTSKAWVSRLCF